MLKADINMGQTSHHWYRLVISHSLLNFWKQWGWFRVKWNCTWRNALWKLTSYFMVQRCPLVVKSRQTTILDMRLYTRCKSGVLKMWTKTKKQVMGLSHKSHYNWDTVKAHQQSFKVYIYRSVEFDPTELSKEWLEGILRVCTQLQFGRQEEDDPQNRLIRDKTALVSLSPSFHNGLGASPVGTATGTCRWWGNQTPRWWAAEPSSACVAPDAADSPP